MHGAEGTEPEKKAQDRGHVPGGEVTFAVYNAGERVELVRLDDVMAAVTICDHQQFSTLKRADIRYALTADMTLSAVPCEIC